MNLIKDISSVSLTDDTPYRMRTRFSIYEALSVRRSIGLFLFKMIWTVIIIRKYARARKKERGERSNEGKGATRRKD